MNLKSLTNKDRYGNMFSVEFFEPQGSVPMMMIIPEMEQSNGYNGADTSDHPGDPRGTDTVPAWLTPGENVVNAEASRIPGNQQMIDEMNDQGRAIQQSQGGPIPTYAAGGSQIPMPDGMLNSLDKILGNKNGGPMYAAEGTLPLGLRQSNPGNIRPGAGFIGESGAKNGYSVFDSDEEGLRAIQRLLGTYGSEHGIDTLEGFANRYAPPSDNNPTSSYVDYLSQKTGIAPDEKINLADRGAELIPAIVGFEQGQMPYTEEQIAMAIEMAGTDDPEAVKAILDGVPPKQSGFSLIGEAQASTLVPPTGGASSASPYLQGMGGATQVPVIGKDVPDKGNVGVNNEIIRNGVSYKYDKETDEYIDAEGRDYSRSALEFGSDVVDSVSDFFSADAGLNKILTDARRNPPKEGDVLVGEMPSGRVVYRDKDGNFSSYLKDWEGTGKIGGGILLQTTPVLNQVLGAEDDIVFNKILESEREVVPPLEEPDSGLKNLDGSMPSKEAEEAVTTIVKENSDKMNPKGDATIQQVLDDADKLGDEADPTLKEKVISSFKDAFADLFTGPELARMAIIYTGSRLMGYSHEGSLGYSAKSLMQREAKFDTQNFDAVKANKDAYTAKSYKDFLKSRDMDDLSEIGKAPLNIKKATGSLWVTGVGQMQAWEDDDGIQYIKVPGGYQKASDLGDLIQPYDKDVFGDKAVISAFSNYAEQAAGKANYDSGLNADDKNLFKITKQKIGEQANSLYRNVLRSNGININNSDQIRQGIQSGIDSYMDAQAQYAKSGKKGTPPGNLESYVREQMITPLTGIDQVQITGVSVQNLKKLDDSIRKDMDIKNPRDPGYAEEYRAEWQAVNNAWSKIGSEARAEAAKQAEKRNKRATNDGKSSQWSAFTYWASNTPAKEINTINDGTTVQ